jgi:N-acetylneuraminic acid mutarotase
MPETLYDATSVPFGDSFLLVGGEIRNFSHVDTVYRYNPTDDTWTLLQARLKEGKAPAIAMLLERRIFDAYEGGN